MKTYEPGVRIGTDIIGTDIIGADIIGTDIHENASDNDEDRVDRGVWGGAHKPTPLEVKISVYSDNKAVIFREFISIRYRRYRRVNKGLIVNVIVCERNCIRNYFFPNLKKMIYVLF